MFFLELVKQEHPALRQIAQPISEVDDNLRKLVKEMAELMYKSEGVGLAAPQVGIAKRLAVVDVGEGLLVLINPEIIYQEGKEIASEGCLTVPGIYGKVERAEKVVVKALNEQGEEYRVAGAGLLARALQHEIDHLDGVLFLDKVLPEENRRK